MAGDKLYHITGPGEFVDPSGRPGRFETTQDGVVFEVAVIPAGNPPAAETQLFTGTGSGQSTKQPIDTNITKQRQLPYNQDMVVHRVGFRVPSCLGGDEISPLDIKQMLESATLLNKVMGIEVFGGELPVRFFQGGYGISGHTNDSGQGVINNGPVGLELVSPMLEPQYVGNGQDIQALVKFPDRSWIANYVKPSFANPRGVPIELVWYGTLVKPAFLQ